MSGDQVVVPGKRPLTRTAFRKGEVRPGQGKHGPNKITKQLKDLILGALADVGGQEYLAKQARENPGPFLTLIGKVLPVTLSGDGSTPFVVQIVRFGGDDDAAQG